MWNFDIKGLVVWAIANMAGTSPFKFFKKKKVFVLQTRKCQLVWCGPLLMHGMNSSQLPNQDINYSRAYTTTAAFFPSHVFMDSVVYSCNLPSLEEVWPVTMPSWNHTFSFESIMQEVK